MKVRKDQIEGDFYGPFKPSVRKMKRDARKGRDVEVDRAGLPFRFAPAAESKGNKSQRQLIAKYVARTHNEKYDPEHEDNVGKDELVEAMNAQGKFAGFADDSNHFPMREYRLKQEKIAKEEKEAKRNMKKSKRLKEDAEKEMRDEQMRYIKNQREDEFQERIRREADDDDEEEEEEEEDIVEENDPVPTSEASTEVLKESSVESTTEKESPNDENNN